MKPIVATVTMVTADTCAQTPWQIMSNYHSNYNVGFSTEVAVDSSSMQLFIEGTMANPLVAEVTAASIIILSTTTGATTVGTITTPFQALRLRVTQVSGDISTASIRFVQQGV